MSEICLNDVELVYDAIKAGVLKPREDPFHLKQVIGFILLRFFVSEQSKRHIWSVLMCVGAHMTAALIVAASMCSSILT